MRKFVIGDTHGAGKALVQVLERCGFDYENDELITIGDVVDGWSDSFMVVEELLKIKNRIDILGNHDDWFNTFIRTVSTAKSYAKASGLDFHVETTKYKGLYGYENIHRTNLLPHHIPESHQAFFRRQMRLYKDDNNNVFIHGGFDRRVLVYDTPKDIAIWDRKLWKQALSAKTTKTHLKFIEEVNQVFIGHTATTGWGSDKPIKADKIWNIDTGAGGGGKLTIMNVDTNEYWQSDLVSELYPNDEHNLRENE
jgi:serine/threonine protein phosphatase 1